VPADLASLSKDNLEMARWNAEWALAALVESLKFFDAETLRPHDGWRTQSAFLFDENPERYARRCLMEQKKILGDVVATIDVLQQEDFLVSFV
jgi:hypothetical protein